MAKDSDGAVLMPNESKLAQAEAGHYIEQQKSANLYTKIADYMFWGATSLILPVVGLATGLLSIPAGFAIAGMAVSSGAVIGTGAIASIATFAGSLLFSRKATELSEKSNVLYSDIDSQNQARRMVQAFARAQAPDLAASNDVPFTSSASNWQDRVGSSKVASSERWQNRIAAQAEREDAMALEQMGR